MTDPEIIQELEERLNAAKEAAEEILRTCCRSGVNEEALEALKEAVGLE